MNSNKLVKTLGGFGEKGGGLSLENMYHGVGYLGIF